jgi:hypothetical protein
MLEGRRGARPVDPPGVLRRVGARRKLELVVVEGGSTERLNSRRPSQAYGVPRDAYGPPQAPPMGHVLVAK